MLLKLSHRLLPSTIIVLKIYTQERVNLIRELLYYWSNCEKNFHSSFQGRYYDDEDLYGSNDSDTETRLKEPRRRNKSILHEKVNDVMVDTLILLITIFISGKSTKADIGPTPLLRAKFFHFHAVFGKKFAK